MKVLIVDDNAVNRRVALGALARLSGAELVQAADGLEALARASSEQPDLILLDVNMPELDGPATFARLRSDPVTAHIPVVFFTACAESDARWLESLGADGVLPKPIDPRALRAAVRAFVERVRTRRLPRIALNPAS